MSLFGNTSRASMDIVHHKYEQGRTDDARRIKEEAHRELISDERREHFYEENINCIPDLTHLNMAFVNDGNGGFKTADSIDEMMEYRESRFNQLKRKPRKDMTVETDIVIHFPKELLVKVTEYSEALGKDITRWAIAGEDEEDDKRIALDFAMTSARFLQSITGDGNVHDFNINLDEHTPHIQFHLDTFLPDHKDPDKLRPAYSDIYGASRGANKAKCDKRGPQKIRDMHKALRVHFRANGYNVALESSERSTEHLENERVKVLGRRSDELDEREYQLAARERHIAEAEAKLERRAIEVAEAERDLDIRADMVAESETYLDDFIENAQVAKDAYLRLRREYESRMAEKVAEAIKTVTDEVLDNSPWISDTAKNKKFKSGKTLEDFNREAVEMVVKPQVEQSITKTLKKSESEEDFGY